MKKRKKCLSLLLALVMVFSLLPISAFAELQMEPESYTIWVGGVQITEENKGNVLGDGAVSYDSEKNILILDGATITEAYDNDGTEKYGIWAYDDLTIALEGLNTIIVGDEERSNVGIFVAFEENADEWIYNNLSIIGDGELRIDAGNVTAEDKNSVGIRANNLSLYGGTVSATAGAVTTGESKGVSLDGELVMEDGILSAKGEEQAICATASGIYNEKRITVASDTSSSLTTWDGLENLFGEESRFKQIHITPTATLYPIWVGDTQVSETNKDDVLGEVDGDATTVTYDSGARRLTLYNAAIDAGTLGYGIWSYIPLTIDLKGDNTITWQSNEKGVNGIYMYSLPQKELTDLAFEGDGNLSIEVPNTDAARNSGIWANNLAVDSTGEIKIDCGEAAEESIAIHLAGNFVQNNGIVSAFANSAEFSHGICIVQGGTATLNNESALWMRGTTEAMDVPAVTVNVDEPSIIASELYGGVSKMVRINKEDTAQLIDGGTTYQTVYITPESRLAEDLMVEVIPVEGASVKVKKSGDTEFQEALDGLREDDIIEVKVEVTDARKELDQVLVMIVDDSANVNEHTLEGNTVLVLGTTKIKAILKDKPVAPSGGGGGQSIVRPDGANTPTPVTPAPVTPSIVTPFEVRFTIASSVMKKGDENVEMGAAPFIQAGRTLVPLRYVAEALGLKVSWDAQSKTVTLSNEKNRIVVPANSLAMQVNGAKVASDVLPVLQGGRVYLSISNIGKALGLENGKDIQWNAQEKAVIIKLPQQ